MKNISYTKKGPGRKSASKSKKEWRHNHFIKLLTESGASEVEIGQAINEAPFVRQVGSKMGRKASDGLLTKRC